MVYCDETISYYEVNIRYLFAIVSHRLKDFLISNDKRSSPQSAVLGNWLITDAGSFARKTECFLSTSTITLTGYEVTLPLNVGAYCNF